MKRVTFLIFSIFLIDCALLVLLRQFSSSSLIFDQVFLICCLTISAGLMGVLYSFKRNKDRHVLIIQFLAFTLGVVLFYNFSNATLLNVDRSRSLYIFSWIQHGEVQIRDGHLDLSRVHSDERLNTVAIKQRLDEQQLRSLVKVDNSGRVFLTSSGRFVLALSKLLARICHLSGWERNSL